MTGAVGLLGELLTFRRDPRIPAVLDRFGVVDIDVQHHVGFGNVDFDGQHFQPHPDGRYAVIVPLVDFGELIDLIAFDPRDPTKWWFRLGGEPLLGASALAEQLISQRLHVYRTPLSWLQHGCDGVVPLDFNRAAIGLITAQNGIVAEDDAHVSELHRALTNAAQWRLPDIYLQKREAA